VHSFTYLPRQSSENGRINEYELYLSEESDNWGTPVKTGSFKNTAAPQTIALSASRTAHYLRLKALSEVNGNGWSSAAELSMVGCLKPASGIRDVYSDDISAFPIPTDGKVNLSILSDNTYRKLNYTLLSLDGCILKQGLLEGYSGELSIDLSSVGSGLYMILLVDDQGIKYRVKVIKK